MQHNTSLIKAVQSLYGKGVISKDKDLADALNYNKTTVSLYLSGKTEASESFIVAFEKKYKLKLADFTAPTVEQKTELQLIREELATLRASMLRIEKLLKQKTT